MWALGLLVLGLLVWLERWSERKWQRENREMQEAIAGLPLDTQVMLLQAKLRHDAEREF